MGMLDKFVDTMNDKPEAEDISSVSDETLNIEEVVDDMIDDMHDNDFNEDIIDDEFEVEEEDMTRPLVLDLDISESDDDIEEVEVEDAGFADFGEEDIEDAEFEEIIETNTFFFNMDESVLDSKSDETIDNSNDNTDRNLDDVENFTDETDIVLDESIDETDIETVETKIDSQSIDKDTSDNVESAGLNDAADVFEKPVETLDENADDQQTSEHYTFFDDLLIFEDAMPAHDKADENTEENKDDVKEQEEFFSSFENFDASFSPERVENDDTKQDTQVSNENKDYMDVMLMDVDEVAESDEDRESLIGIGAVAEDDDEKMFGEEHADIFKESLERQVTEDIYPTSRPETPTPGTREGGIGDSEVIELIEKIESANKEEGKASFAGSNGLTPIFDSDNIEIKIHDFIAFETYYNLLGEVIGIGENCFFTRRKGALAPDGSEAPVIDQWFIDPKDPSATAYYHYREDDLTSVIDDLLDPDIPIEDLAGRFRKIVRRMRENAISE